MISSLPDEESSNYPGTIYYSEFIRATSVVLLQINYKFPSNYRTKIVHILRTNQWYFVLHIKDPLMGYSDKHFRKDMLIRSSAVCAGRIASDDQPVQCKPSLGYKI